MGRMPKNDARARLVRLPQSSTNHSSLNTTLHQVYYIAKKMTKPCSPEEFGLALAKHFIAAYARLGHPVRAVVGGVCVGRKGNMDKVQGEILLSDSGWFLRCFTVRNKTLLAQNLRCTAPTRHVRR